MALSTTTSRFAFLTDDAADPFEKKKKKTAAAGASAGAGSSKSKKTGSVSTDKAKNPNKSGNKNGTPSEQGKKKKPATNDKMGDANKNLPSICAELPEHHSAGPRGISESSATEPDEVACNDNETKTTKKKSKGKPTSDENLKDPQWEDWKKRDQEFVTGSFETDLEAALIQSKLECQKDESKAKPRKNKNKPAAVSLSEFNQMIGCGGGRPDNGLVDPNWPKNLNGFATILPPPGLVQSSGKFEQDQDAALMEQFRRETQLEIERERRLEIERSILKSRCPIPQGKGKKEKGADTKPANSKTQNLNSILSAATNPTELLAQNDLLREKDQQIAELTSAKADLETKVEDLGAKFKKLCSILADSQLKEKAKLVHENEKLTQLNVDLNEQVTLLHSQLEQEKSKCSQLAADLRKQEFARKRTQSNSDMNN